MQAIVETRTLRTADGLALEAETASVEGNASCGAVLCHPHPMYGGSMRSIVISALFSALPARGVSCVRFNFRGVERSEGTHGEGRDEPADVVAALDAVADAVGAQTPILLVGWSFGADMALSVADPRLAGWVAIAPPLRFAHDLEAIASDPRPKGLILAEHDEFREPTTVRDETSMWRNTTVDVVGGASHFFVGRTDRVVELTAAFAARLNG